MSERRKRVTIGVLVSGILDEFTKYVCKGALEAARGADVNVVIVPGKYIDRDLSGQADLMYEYQYNTVFSYIKKENIDAIVCTADSIGCFSSKKKTRELLAQYRDIPCVLIASKLEGYPHVVFDNQSGIREGLEYLIREKGCTCFGMVGGSEENSDASERRRTFEEVLRENDIPFEERQFAQGDMSCRCVRECAKLLEDNPDLEAVFCANDEIAMAMYEAVKQRGLLPGKDIFVFGYDDTAAASKVDPSLSSIRADSAKLGEEAVRMVLSILGGARMDSHIVPTRFIMRDSFARTWNDEERTARENDGDDSGFEDVFYWYLHEESNGQIEVLRAAYEKMIHELTEGFAGQVPEHPERREIMKSVEAFLGLEGVEYADMDKLSEVMEDIYGVLLGQQRDDYGRYQLRDFFSKIYRKMALAMNKQFGSMKQKKERENYEIKLFVQNVLQFDNCRDESYGLLLSNLEWLGIRNAAIYLLSQPRLHLFGEPFRAPSNLHLKALLTDGRTGTVALEEQKQRIETLFENPYVHSDARFERVLLPLFSNEAVYGILFCDMDESLFVNGEFLVNQISSAIKMLTLLRMNGEIQEQLEENLATLRAHNIELNQISRSDMLTGILNRRGFFEEANELIDRRKTQGKRTLLLYVDMNNLKIINDRYGHEEGDFSLKTIGRILTETVDAGGVVGRIGGDEFACAMEYDAASDGSEMLSVLYQQFEHFNASSEKSYNVTVSVGVYLIEPGNTAVLEEALACADEMLYLEKQHRKKSVQKGM